MQFISCGVYEIIFAQLMWQCIHGAPVFIYLFLNKSMKTELFRIIGLESKTAPAISVNSNVTFSNNTAPNNITTSAMEEMI